MPDDAEGLVDRDAKGEDLLQRRRVVVFGRVAEDGGGGGEVGIEVVALVAQVDQGEASSAVEALEEGPHLGERVAVQRLQQA